MKIIEKSLIVDIEQIKNWEQNPRAIKKEDFERLKNQINEIGVYKPLLCECQPSIYIAIGGNMRLRALKELQRKEVWITVVEFASVQEKIKIALSDNDNVGYYDDQQLAELMYPYKDQIWKDYKVNFETPKFNMDAFLKGQFEDGVAGDKEKDEDKETEQECPKCGHKFT